MSAVIHGSIVVMSRTAHQKKSSGFKMALILVELLSIVDVKSHIFAVQAPIQLTAEMIPLLLMCHAYMSMMANVTKLVFVLQALIRQIVVQKMDHPYPRTHSARIAMTEI